ncbi:MAG: FAD-binding oxidoreductase, partial [Chloroflexi bacterium]|nr:FAD-binding oxidoreductase [Chloroflexota bacterium]
ASAGCLHIRPIIDAKKASEIAKLPEIARFAVDLLQGYGGAWSSEHGDGRSRSWLNKQFFGPDLYGLYQQVKQIFDPDNLFNPDNIVEAGAMTDNLRYGGGYEVIPLQSQLAFVADNGFHRAVEMCNGAGVCRKQVSGSMCPSFMATREEEHSTRGRANALRAAMSGTLPADELTSKRMYQVMELCVSCKACKSECPSSVDMARIKTEFLAQYQAKHGIPLRSRIFAHINLLSRLGSGMMAPLANWSLKNGLVRAGMARFLGISRERPLPQFARVPFMRFLTQRLKDAKREKKRSQVVLFVDTYHNFNYPHVAQAALEVLEAAGFEVIVPTVHDCGRPAFSKGLVGMARETAVTVLNSLTPFAQDGLPIIFLEPSDQSMVSDDYEALLSNDARVKLVAQQCVSFEEFIAREAGNGRLQLTFTDEPRHILLHGHCHQKALIGTKPAHQALTLPPNYTLAELDTSCCGMAGSFGYEAEQGDISLKMAERRLLPGARAAAPDTIIVASGTSCRQQVKYGTGRQALHPAEVLRDALT